MRKRRSHKPISGKAIAIGLLGRLIIVLGIHFIVGASVGMLGSAVGAPIIELCTGPQCAVGVDAGAWGPFTGVALILAGVLVALAGRTKAPATPLSSSKFVTYTAGR